MSSGIDRKRALERVRGTAPFKKVPLPALRALVNSRKRLVVTNAFRLRKKNFADYLNLSEILRILVKHVVAEDPS